jgi:hypothetical protein
VKKKDHEKLTQENIRHVIALLSTEKPITKKEACGILNISYNTTRLNNIIQEFEDRESFRATRKSQLKGKRATKEEIKDAIQSYLRGESVSEIAQGMYRSSGFIKAILDRVGVPTRPAAVEDRMGYAFLPEQCIAEEFMPGETVWSAFNHAPALVEKEHNKPLYIEKYGSKCYSIYVLEKTDGFTKGGYYAASLACDLGKLTHLEEYGIDLEKI